MRFLRGLLFLLGTLLTFAGSFFALQGAGIIMWPAESYMLADKQWVTNGVIIAVVGVALLLIARRTGRSS